MTDITKALKPHFEDKKSITTPTISSTVRKKIIKEMTELIKENNKIE